MIVDIIINTISISKYDKFFPLENIALYIIWLIQMENEKGLGSREWELNLLCHRWLLKRRWSSVVRLSCSKIKRPCGSRAFNGGARGWVSQLRQRNFPFCIPTTTPRNNFAMSRVCNTIKYRRCACRFLIALFPFENISCENARLENRRRFAGKNDTARALLPFPPRQKKDAEKHIRTRTKPQNSWYFFFSLLAELRFFPSFRRWWEISEHFT